MADQAALLRAFSDFARTIARDYDIGDVLYRLTDHVVEVLNVDGAGVSIADERDHLMRFVTATDDRVAALEERQITSGEGPCHDAFEAGDRVTSADLQAEDRWPEYRPLAVQIGLLAVAGIPMAADDHRIGALNLYAERPREWPADDLEVAQLLADMATGYILNVRTLDAGRRLSTQLQHALSSRIVIEQAKGVIAERHAIDTSAAFEVLRDHARRNNRRLHDVAQAIVEGRGDVSMPPR